MAAKLIIIAFASALLVQTITGQNTNAGIIDITNVGITGNGIGLANNGNSYGYGSGFSGNTNAGVIDVTNVGVAGNGIGLANNGNSYGYRSGFGNTNAGVIDITNLGITGNGIGLANNGNSYGNGYGYGSGVGNTNAGVIEITNVGVSGNGIGLSNNNGGYSYGTGYGLTNAGVIDIANIGVAGNGIGLANIGNIGYNGIATSGIGASYGSISNCGYSAPALSYGVGFGNGYGANSVGGAFAVSCSSPLAPTGLAVVSENAIDGAVNVNGAVPFLSAVALEGQVASGGAGGIQYSCGDGHFGIVSDNGDIGAGNIGLAYVNGLGAGYGFGAPIGGSYVGPAVINNYASPCGCNAY